mgnify:CR=1 FL=1
MQVGTQYDRFVLYTFFGIPTYHLSYKARNLLAL